MAFVRRRSRIQQAMVEIGDASSGFLQFVPMAFRGDRRSQVVHRHRDPLLAYAAPNADPVPGRLHLPSARHLLGQHSPTWDERSSPGELIHPGEMPSISSIISDENLGAGAASQCHPRGWRKLGRLLVGAAGRGGWGSGQSLIGCRRGLGAPVAHPPLWLPGASGST